MSNDRWNTVVTESPVIKLSKFGGSGHKRYAGSVLGHHHHAPFDLLFKDEVVVGNNSPKLATTKKRKNLSQLGSYSPHIPSDFFRSSE